MSSTSETLASNAVPGKTNVVQRLRNYVGGKWMDSRSTEFLPVMNPSVGEQIAEVPLSAAQDVDEAVRSAHQAFPAWSSTPIKERTQVFYRYKTLLEKNAQSLAELVQREID
jgi:malonate-semialdehyde dehydrogenase (acetylating)/methylmalonate-semialdehyde dehydrogenase